MRIYDIAIRDLSVLYFNTYKDKININLLFIFFYIISYTPGHTITPRCLYAYIVLQRAYSEQRN